MIASKNERFQKIYSENFEVVRHVIRMFRSLSNDVEDILHDVFLNFYQKMDTTEISNERTYLKVAARNACLSRLDKKRTQKTDLAQSEDTSPEGRIWESDSDHELNLQLISELLEELAKEEPGGKAFYMFYKEGLSLREIAAKTGEPIGTIGARVARLRERMKKMIRDRAIDFQ